MELLLYAFLWGEGIKWSKKNRRASEVEELSMHRLKVLFLYSLNSWSKLFVGDRPMSFFYSIDWLDLP